MTITNIRCLDPGTCVSLMGGKIPKNKLELDFFVSMPQAQGMILSWAGFAWTRAVLKTLIICRIWTLWVTGTNHFLRGLISFRSFFFEKKNTGAKLSVSTDSFNGLLVKS